MFLRAIVLMFTSRYSGSCFVFVAMEMNFMEIELIDLVTWRRVFDTSYVEVVIDLKSGMSNRLRELSCCARERSP